MVTSDDNFWSLDDAHSLQSQLRFTMIAGNTIPDIDDNERQVP